MQRPQRGFLKSGLIVLAAFIAIIALLVFVIAFLGAPADEREEGRRGATTERVTESGLEFG